MRPKSQNQIELRLIRNITQNVDDQTLLWLELHVEGGMELPLVWLIAVTFNSMWKMRVKKGKAQSGRLNAVAYTSTALRTHFALCKVLQDKW